jgi:anti-sigma factor RsiW
MKCEEVKKRMLETIKRGKIEPEISLHLQNCEGCFRTFEEYRGLFKLLEGEPEPSLEEVRSPQYLVSLRERIDTSERGWLFGYPKPGFVMALASVMVFALLLFNLSNFSSKFPEVANYTPASTFEYAERPASVYSGVEEELAYLLSEVEVQENEGLPQLLSTSEATSLLQAEELLSSEVSLPALLENLSEEEIEMLSQTIQNLMSVFPSKDSGVKRC